MMRLKRVVVLLLFLGLILPASYSCSSKKSVPKRTVRKTKKQTPKKTATKRVAKVVKKKGVASYYADKFNGRKTANGEVFSNDKQTAAHKTLPFGTFLKVTNLTNGKWVEVRVNDRGPFVRGRDVDLSQKAFKAIAGSLSAGILNVKIEILK